jgi:hypothetical protein
MQFQYNRSINASIDIKYSIYNIYGPKLTFAIDFHKE